MRVAVQASDLDAPRIDGTRVYLKELLNRFGGISPESEFLLYHKGSFNPALAPKMCGNYSIKTIPFPFLWMQTRFAWEMFREKPDKLFLPVQAAPIFFPSSVEMTATIHDLAFKRYPETFPKKFRWKLNTLLDVVVKRADKLIAVSESTKRDLLEFFPHLSEQRIKVIHHGFDSEFFGKRVSDQEKADALVKYQLQAMSYILYVGALQPRKNLVRLVKAFESAKKTQRDMKLVLAGEEAWLSEPILEAVKRSQYAKDIILTGRVSFEDLRCLYQGARLFAFPSLYEGFGLPILEAFASGVPVLASKNSSLVEVASDAAAYCDAENIEDMADALTKLWTDGQLRGALVERGKYRLDSFSWDTCAEKTLQYILH